MTCSLPDVKKKGFRAKTKVTMNSSADDEVELQYLEECSGFAEDEIDDMSGSKQGLWKNRKVGAGKKFTASQLIFQAAQQKKNEETREKEKSLLDDTISELESTKSRAENEAREKSNLQSQLDELQEKYEDSIREVDKSAKQVEKMRTEVKTKAGQIAKLERDHYRMEGKIKHLEYRVSEVDKAELEIDNLQKQLDSSQSDCREKDTELRHCAKEIEGYKKQLKDSNEKVKELEEQMVDLKLQVIEELKKNDHIEQLLDSIPHLKEKIKQKDQEIMEVQKQLEDKTVLLQVARKSNRDAKDKLKAMDKRIEAFQKVENELQMAKCETTTLKSLMVGKDTLVIQKSQALDFARGVIEALDSNNNDNNSTESYLSDKIDRIYDRLKFMATYPQRTQFEDHFRSSSPYSEPPPHSARPQGQSRSNSAPMPTTKSLYHDSENNKNEHFSESSSQGYASNRTSQDFVSPRESSEQLDDVQENEACDSDEESLSSSMTSQQGRLIHNILKKDSLTHLNEGVYQKTQRTKHRPKTAVVRPNSHMRSFKNFRQRTPSVTDEVTIDLKPGSQPNSPRLGSSRPVSAKTELSLTSTENSSQGDCGLSLKCLSAMEKDQLTTNFVRVGDRVLVKLPVRQFNCSRRKRKDLPVKYQQFYGMVKFIGTVDKEYADHRLNVGLRMDSNVGDMDGAYKGKRYFYVPEAHGKLVRLSNIISVLNVKDSKYHNIESLLKDYLRKHTNNSEQLPSECDQTEYSMEHSFLARTTQGYA